VRRTTSILAVLLLVLAACGTGTSEDTSTGGTDGTTTAGGDTTPDSTTTGGGDGDRCEGATDGVLVWAHEQEPPDLHLNDPNNGLSVTSYIWQAMWEDLYGVTEDITFYPELLAEEAVVAPNDDGSATISYKLRDGLTWSDGEPLTSADVKFTYDIIMEGVDPETGSGGVYLISARTGYDQITDFTVSSPTEFSITFDPFFSGYKALFTNVFPAHAFGEGAGAAEVNAAQATWTNADGQILPSSGAMVFDSWERGVAMNLVRNDGYHGSVSPDAVNRGPACVSGVRIAWVADTDAQINALRAGEAQVIFTQPQLAFEELRNDENFTIAAKPGPIYEHWGLNVNNTHLSKPEVREALALALDKAEVVTTLYAPLFGDAIAPEGLGNTYWMSNQPQYQDHQGPAGYGSGDVDGAKASLEAAGYVLGGDGIYEHPADGRLTLRVGTTGGNALRELQQQIIQAQMKEAGIEIVIDNVPGADYFTEQPFSPENLLASASGGEQGDTTVVDIMQFAWVGGPWPGGQSQSYLSGTVVEGDGGPEGSTGNPYGFQNADFDARATECDSLLDEAGAAACYNELDRYVTTLELDPVQGLFMLPLTQKPDFFSYSNIDLLHGAVAPDANTAGPLANVVDYALK
jgi:peptide/nickel transport system substrate-binding protein